jgi:uncharacterized protein
VTGDAKTTNTAEKLSALRASLRKLESVLVCYSGGIDSALVLAVASAELGERAVGMTAVGPSLAEADKADAARIARAVGARHEFVNSSEIERPGYVANAPDRCFHCKSELYFIAEQKRSEWGLAHLANGTNIDDLGDYRPGLEAARQAGVKSPLVDLRFSKDDVRAVAKLFGMEVWDKPANACLSSRIPYGTSVTTERLAQVGGVEARLKALGFRQVRARYHDDIVRIEVDASELSLLVDDTRRRAVVQAGKDHGFRYVTIDLGGYRTGSLNDVLVGKSLKVV